MTFQPKGRGKFPGSDVLIWSPNSDNNAKCQCGVEGRGTVCEDVALDSCTNTNTHTNRYACMPSHIHTACANAFMCVNKVRDMQTHSHTQTHKYTLSIICKTLLLVVKWPCCHSSLHLFPWGWTGERKRKWRMEREGERESWKRGKESAWDCKSVTKARHWFWDGELMKPRPDMTVQCQTVKSYAGRRALAAIILQIVCVWGWQKKKQDKLKRHSLKKERKAILRRNVGASLGISVALNGSVHSQRLPVSSYLRQTLCRLLSDQSQLWWIKCNVSVLWLILGGRLRVSAHIKCSFISTIQERLNVSVVAVPMSSCSQCLHDGISLWSVWTIRNA